MHLEDNTANVDRFSTLTVCFLVLIQMFRHNMKGRATNKPAHNDLIKESDD